MIHIQLHKGFIIVNYPYEQKAQLLLIWFVNHMSFEYLPLYENRHYRKIYATMSYCYRLTELHILELWSSGRQPSFIPLFFLFNQICHYLSLILWNLKLANQIRKQARNISSVALKITKLKKTKHRSMQYLIWLRKKGVHCWRINVIQEAFSLIVIIYKYMLSARGTKVHNIF